MTKLAEADIIAMHKTNMETQGSARAHNEEISAHHPVNHRHSPNFSSPKLPDAQFAKLSPHQTFPLYGNINKSKCKLYTTTQLQTGENIELKDGQILLKVLEK